MKPLGICLPSGRVLWQPSRLVRIWRRLRRKPGLIVSWDGSGVFTVELEPPSRDFPPR